MNVVLTKWCGNAHKHFLKAILKQLQTHFKEKYEKGVGTPFPRVPTTHPSLLTSAILLGKLI